MPGPHPRLSSRDLAMVVAVADHGSLRRAATASGLTVAGISKQLRILEDRLGILLFMRTASGVQATTAGKRLAADGRRILADIDATLDAIAVHASPAGRVVIGAGPFVASAVAGSLNAAVHARWPDIQIELRPGYAEDHLAQLQAGTLDFAICHLEDQSLPPSLVAQPLQHLVPAFVARANHPLAGRPAIHGHVLLPFGFAGSRPYAASLVWLESLLDSPPRYEFVSSDYALISDTLATSDLVSVMSRGLARKLAAERGHVLLDVPSPPFIHIVWLIEPATGIAAVARRVAHLAVDLLARDERQEPVSTSG